MFSITQLQAIDGPGCTGEKPQSKLCEDAGRWWTVMANSEGTSVYRLDGTSWAPTQQIATNDGVRAGLKRAGVWRALSWHH